MALLNGVYFLYGEKDIRRWKSVCVILIYFLCAERNGAAQNNNILFISIRPSIQRETEKLSLEMSGILFQSIPSIQRETPSGLNCTAAPNDFNPFPPYREKLLSDLFTYNNKRNFNPFPPYREKRGGGASEAWLKTIFQSIPSIQRETPSFQLKMGSS